MRSGGTLWGCGFGRGCLREFPTAGAGGAGKAMEAAGKSEIRRFRTALVTESWCVCGNPVSYGPLFLSQEQAVA